MLINLREEVYDIIKLIQQQRAGLCDKNITSIWPINWIIHENGYKIRCYIFRIYRKGKQKNDLKLADLEYLKIDYLKKLQKSGASFILKVKSNTALYMKNKKRERYKIGGIKKSSRYIKLDIFQLSKFLIEGANYWIKKIFTLGLKKNLEVV